MDKVCHFELPYDDKQRMEKFYSAVFGWQFMEAPTEHPYTFAMTTPMDENHQFTESGGINGGTYQRSDEGGSKHPVIVMEVDSCEQRLQAIEAAGGSKLMDPHTIEGMGIYAQVKDTEDNIIGLWQPLHGGGQSDS